MIGLCTRVLVRFLTQDDLQLARLASAAMAQLTPERPGLICRKVLVELVWVLEKSYEFGRQTYLPLFQGCLRRQTLSWRGADAVAGILRLYEFEGFGFADLMIRAEVRRFGAMTVLTSDQKAAALEGMVILGAGGLPEP